MTNKIVGEGWEKSWQRSSSSSSSSRSSTLNILCTDTLTSCDPQLLTIAVPMVKVDGAPDIFAKSGSTVSLFCRVRDNTITTAKIEWWVEQR